MDNSHSLPLLLPKHLRVAQKRVVSLRNIKYEEPAAERARREKKKFMKPLSDIELIMRKMKEVIEEKKTATQTPTKNEKLQRKFETDLNRKISGLLALPTVRNIKAKAQQFRMKTVASDTATVMFAEANRLSILKSFEDYVSSSSKPIQNKRAKTEAEASPTFSPLRFL